MMGLALIPLAEPSLFESTPIFLSVVGIIFIAATIRATIGFGDAVLALPVLNLLVDSHVAQPLMALCSLMIAIWMTWMDWRDLAFAKTWRLLLTVCLGMPIGVFFLKTADASLVKAGLAIFVIGFAVFRAVGGARLKKVPPVEVDYVVGFLTGILCGAYNILGVVLAVYATLAGWELKQLRVTLQGVMLPAGLVLVANHLWWGLITTETVKAFAFVLPLLIVAGIIGQFAAQRFKPSQFDRIITVTLLVVGVMLLASAISMS